MTDHHVIVRFGKGVPSDLQGWALMHLERFLREQGCPAECFKETAPDDSKLRRLMTVEERAKL